MDTQHTSRVTSESYAVAMTADCAIFGFSRDALRVLLVRRAVEVHAALHVVVARAPLHRRCVPRPVQSRPHVKNSGNLRLDAST